MSSHTLRDRAAPKPAAPQQPEPVRRPAGNKRKRAASIPAITDLEEEEREITQQLKSFQTTSAQVLGQMKSINTTMKAFVKEGKSAMDMRKVKKAALDKKKADAAEQKKMEIVEADPHLTVAGRVYLCECIMGNDKDAKQYFSMRQRGEVVFSNWLRRNLTGGYPVQAQAAEVAQQ